MSNQFLIYLSTLGPILEKFSSTRNIREHSRTFDSRFFLSWQLDLAFFYISFFFIPLIIVGIPICNKAEQISWHQGPKRGYLG